jgi:hypothetical protein
MTTEYTTHFRLNLPDFRYGPWHDLVNQDFVSIDDLLFGLYQGVDTTVWTNNFHWMPGDTAIDTTDNSYWVCIVEHTSAPTGTFAADRAAHPTYWNRIVVGLSPRGIWAHDTHYLVNDVVSDPVQHVIAQCLVNHTSNHSGTIRDDQALGYWVFIADMSATAVSAVQVSYDHTLSGTTKTNVQDAIDEQYAHDASQQTTINGHTTTIGTHTSQISALQSNDATQDGNIAANTSAIATNTANIATNASNISTLTTSKADLASPTFTGDPKAPTPATADNDTSIATTAFVKAQGYITNSALATYAPLASPAFTGVPTAPTAAPGTNNTQVATTAFVYANIPGGTSTVPLMDGVAAVGAEVFTYARGDHRHPSDTSKLSDAPSDGNTYGRKNGAWAIGAAAVTIADTPPGGPIAGNLWWESDSGQMFIYFNDGSSSQWVAAAARASAPMPTILRGYIDGYTLSTAGSSTTFTAGVGQCADSTNTDYISLTAALNKTTAAWAAGSGVGSLDTGAIATGNYYNVFAIKNPTTAAVDILISLSATTPTLPSGYTLFRRVATLLYISNVWYKFTQRGDEFLLDPPVTLASSQAYSVTAALIAAWGGGVAVNAFGQVRSDYATNAATFTLSSPDIAAPAVGTTTTTNVVSGTSTNSASYFNLRTNAAGQIRWQANGTGPTFSIGLFGYIDNRGKSI